jgi:hypothetical protein
VRPAPCAARLEGEKAHELVKAAQLAEQLAERSRTAELERQRADSERRRAEEEAARAAAAEAAVAQLQVGRSGLSRGSAVPRLQGIHRELAPSSLPEALDFARPFRGRGRSLTPPSNRRVDRFLRTSCPPDGL